MKPETYRQALTRAFSLLQEAGHNPQIAEWLCLHLCQCTKTEWLDRLDLPISVEEGARLNSWLQRVLNGEPYQYILGVQDFYGREFQVSPAVLIPRPETEVLVEQVLHKVQEIWSGSPQSIASSLEQHCRPLTGVDVGTGSGAIAITLDLELNLLDMLAVDISAAALEVAQANAQRLEANVSFRQSDLLQTLIEQGEQVDLIISNPPYIPYAEQDKLDGNVVDFEPHLALFAEEDGLYFYKEIIKQARAVLKSPGLLAFEVGMGQAPAVSTLIQETYPQATCQINKDLSGIERIVLATIL